MGFCEHAFSKNSSHVQLIDEQWMNWPCHLTWDSGRPFYCNFIGGRQEFCIAKYLTGENVIRLGTSNNRDGNIYFKFSQSGIFILVYVLGMINFPL